MIDAADPPGRVAEEIETPPKRHWHPPALEEVDHSETGSGSGALTLADEATYNS